MGTVRNTSATSHETEPHRQPNPAANSSSTAFGGGGCHLRTGRGSGGGLVLFPSARFRKKWRTFYHHTKIARSISDAGEHPLLFFVAGRQCRRIASGLFRARNAITERPADRRWRKNPDIQLRPAGGNQHHRRHGGRHPGV